MGWLDTLKQVIWPQVQSAATMVANLKAVEHGLHVTRDQAEYAGVRADCAKRIGCTPERLAEVLTAIADAAHAACP
jgi:hypothetical protein